MATIDFDIFLNVIKRPESVIYKTRVGPQSANIAYVGSSALSSDANLMIEDKSTVVPANTVYENVVGNLLNQSTLSLKNGMFLLTDTYSSGNATTGSIARTPLFYKHVLKNFNPDASPIAQEIKNIKLFDDLFSEMTVSEKFLDAQKGIFYSNLNSFYNIVPDNLEDPDSVEYTFYYIQYTVIDKNDPATEITYFELLDNQPVYKQATLEDYDFNTNMLDLEKKVYTLTPLGASFQIELPSARDISYKYTEDKRLKVKWPTSKNYSDPWFVRVLNGEVYFGGNIYKIAFEQFHAQGFNPVIGTKKVSKEAPTIINKKIIKLDYEDIRQDPNVELFIEIRVSDENGISKGNFTTNINHADTTYKYWTKENRVGIKSINHAIGFIELEGIDLAATDLIECDYYRFENSYEFTEVDFNPIRNESILERRTLIYIDPADLSQSLKLKQFTLKGEDIDDPLNGETLAAWKQNSIEFQNGNLFILAELTVGESGAIKDLASLDTRISGGSVKKNKVLEVEEQYPEYDYTWDQAAWDGKPYPGNLCFYLEVPIEGLIKEAGGIHSPSDLKEVAKVHSALGSYCVAKGYGAETEITSFLLLNNQDGTANVKINWLGVDTYRYKVYFKKIIS